MLNTIKTDDSYKFLVIASKSKYYPNFKPHSFSFFFAHFEDFNITSMGEVGWRDCYKSPSIMCKYSWKFKSRRGRVEQTGGRHDFNDYCLQQFLHQGKQVGFDIIFSGEIHQCYRQTQSDRNQSRNPLLWCKNENVKRAQQISPQVLSLINKSTPMMKKRKLEERPTDPSAPNYTRNVDNHTDPSDFFKKHSKISIKN